MYTTAAPHHVTVLQALLRDGYRCCLSGFYDYESVQTWPAVEAMAKPEYVRTECCHILSEGALQNVGEEKNQARGPSFISSAQH